MDITLPNGNVIKDVPMTATKEAVKQKAIAAGLATEADFATAPPEAKQGKATTRNTAELFKDSLKKGVASPLALGETAAGFLGLPNAEKAMRSAKESAYESLGVTDFAPTSFSQRLAAGVGEAVTDPTNLVGAGVGKAVGTGLMTAAGKVAKAGVEGGAAGGGAVFGEQLGSALGGQAGGLVGSLAGAVAGGTALNRAGNAANVGASVAKSALGSGATPEDLKKFTEDAVTIASSEKIRGIFVGALKTNPDLMKEVMRSEEFKNVLKAGLPASATFGSNPYIDSIIRRLLETNPEFRGLYARQYEEAKAAIESRKKALFGGSEAAVEGLTQLGTENRLATVQKSVDKRMKAIDKQAELLSKKVGTAADSQELGNKIDALLKEKEKLARQEVEPLYTNALDYANQQGITMPADSVKSIYEFVNDSRNSDIFAKFPALTREITSKLAPKGSGGGTEIVQGVEVPSAAVQTFEGITPDVIDSLKRRLNKDLRETNDGSQRSVLKDLRSLFEQGLDAIPDAKFVEDYRAADAAYKSKVSIPFGASSIQMIDRANFAEQVVPKITLNASSLDEFMEAVGEEGKPLVNNAFRSDFINKTVKNGVIDKAAADKWFKQKGYLKDVDPELLDELRGATAAVNGLEIQKLRLNSQFKDAKAKQIFELADKNPEQLFNQLKNPTEYAKFIRTYGNNKDAIDGAKALALANISKSTDPLKDLTDSALSPTYKKLFGKDYKRVMEVMEASQRLRKSVDPDAIRTPTSSVEADSLKKNLGVSAPEVLSQFRNPILGAVRAAANVASKVFQKMTEKSYDSQVSELFLNPELGKVMIFANKVNDMPDGDAKKAAADKLMKMTEKVSDMLFAGTAKQAAKSAVVGAGSMPDQIQPEEQEEGAMKPLRIDIPL